MLVYHAPAVAWPPSPIWMSVQADCATLDMEVDTGASSSVIREVTY